jgi:hypothetical protein
MIITAADYQGSPLEKAYAQNQLLSEKSIRNVLASKLMKGDISQKLHDNAIKDLERIIEKAGKGEGTRGGHIIGHTQSGKAIYAGKDAHHYQDFNQRDHEDAAEAHGHEAYSYSRRASNNHYGGLRSEAERFEKLSASHTGASKGHYAMSERMNHAEKTYKNHMELHGKMNDAQRKKYRSQIKTVHDVGMAMAGEKDPASLGRFDAHKKYLEETKRK